MLHRVRRQTWRLRMGSAEAAFAARARFRAEVEDLLPAFGRAFDAWTPDGEVLRIPRLEIELRVASLDELERALAEALRREPRPPPSARRLPAPAEYLSVLLRYLRTGALEWHAARADAAAVAARLRETALAELRAAAAGIAENATLSERSRYFLRLLQILPGERWPEVARHLGRTGADAPASGAPAGPEAALAELAVARATHGAALTQRLAAMVLASATLREEAAALRLQLAAIFGDEVAAPPGELAARIAALPAATARILAARAALAMPKAGNGQPDSDAAIPQPSRESKPPRTDEPSKTRSRPAIGARLAGTDEVDAPLRERAGTMPDEIEEAEAAEPFALMASYAGLVLLHPFLPRLFEARGLYAERKLASLPRAAALLHWLATGADEPYEFELATVKVLLGLRPDTPLPVGAGLLTDAHRDEGAELLRAAIRHWKALKGTSIDGLRISFLQRRGALREDETGWRLQPEPESFDVLLGHLPWSISTVRLPWMTRPLFTDWPTP